MNRLRLRFTMHRGPQLYSLAMLVSLAVHGGHALAPRATALPEYRVEASSWQYARLGATEVLTRASLTKTRELLVALQRGERLYPDFVFHGMTLPLILIVVDEPAKLVPSLAPLQEVPADAKLWSEQHTVYDGVFQHADQEGHVIAINLSGMRQVAKVYMAHANQRFWWKTPTFPSWAKHGLMGRCGIFQAVIAVPQTTTIQLPRLHWPDPHVDKETFPPEAARFPPFTVMFDPTRDPEKMTEAERWQYEFQSALFARWSLFGPAKNGRNRNGYWAFAEWARRGQADEQVFRQCYGMTWAQACDEMRAYLQTKAVGMLDVRMPHVMAEVPEADALELREATPEEMRRILGEYARLAAMCDKDKS